MGDNEHWIEGGQAKMKKPKIVFFDIDGTLFTKEMKMPVATKKAIQAIKKDGIHVGIATGRAPFMFETLQKELEIDTYVGFNGSYVALHGEVISKKPLSTEWLERLQREAQENEHPMVFLDGNSAAADTGNHEAVAESLGYLKMPYPPVQKDFYKNKEIYQALIFCNEKEEQMYRNTYRMFHFVRWHRYSIDILPFGQSKAEGIRSIVSHLGYSMEETAAFGDGLNDVEMIQEVGVGVAMGNAVDAVKESADFVTTHVNEDGIVNGLKKLQLL